ncbi:cell division protein FtsI/penicillin-binding protein 2 [Williamsia limnetica]|uniref:Cell division protein FtsI/penicillin-binding protein 2 n=1 Tax=Williamsia limnetica TaxID=882452 RepID=A0A318RTH8_WILLI|nr:penicillin-binding transpeptidase domain-containing protein [Williamsia limnetica]PYE20302.1 cell division protein FtsI/penicillin-binding protein 2 [Williamsia limnetica]
MRNVERTRLAAGILLMVTTLLTAGCAALGDNPEDPFGSFASALSSGDASKAAEHTTDPAAAESAISDMFTHLGENAEVRVSAHDVDDESGTGLLTMSWEFGEGRGLDYETGGRAIDTDDGWRLEWSSTLLHKNLAPGTHLQYSDDKNVMTPVVDRGGAALMTWHTVGVVTLRRDALSEGSAALAPVLAGIDPSITDKSIKSAAGQQQTDVVTVATLRERDLDSVRSRLESISGVTVVEQGKLLTVDRALKSPLLGGIDKAWNDRISRGAGWSVSIVDDSGNPVDQLTSVAAQPADPLQLTLDRRLQLLAQQAVAAQGKPAVLVAMSTSTGGLLAVAQNSAADAGGAIALSGLYPPGSTFKTITTAAALSSGTATPDTVLPCPGRATIEGRTIPNEDDFDLGAVPLSTAFSRSCNTTMATLSNRLGPDALPAVAEQLGLGVDFVVPGIVTVTGAVPRADSPALRVENGIGQGSVTASPFGMAVVEASLGHGSMVLPSLIVGETTTANMTPEPLDPRVIGQLRAMMRQTVTSGTASALSDIGGLGGKTGTAEYGDSGDAHGWFTGISGDIAFASLVVGGGSSQPAVEVAGDFLRPANEG